MTGLTLWRSPLLGTGRTLGPGGNPPFRNGCRSSRARSGKAREFADNRGGGSTVQQALVEAEFEVLRVFGIDVYATKSLDGKDPAWLPRHHALLVGTDLTAEEAQDVACDVLGLITAELADAAW